MKKFNYKNRSILELNNIIGIDTYDIERQEVTAVCTMLQVQIAKGVCMMQVTFFQGNETRLNILMFISLMRGDFGVYL